MRHRIVPVFLSVLALLGAGSASAEEEWSYEMVPYVWAASMSGREGFGSSPPEVSASFKDLLEFVNVGASMRFFARRPPVNWFAEASYVELKDDIGTPVGTVRVKSDQVLAEGGLSYEFNPAIAVYAGLRYQEVDTRVELGSTRLSGNDGWVDGIVGARWTPLVSDHWVAWVRGDVGGGSSDLVWLAEAGAGYRWGTRWGAYLAYRLLDTDYRHGDFIYDVRENGFLLGFGIRF